MAHSFSLEKDAVYRNTVQEWIRSQLEPWSSLGTGSIKEKVYEDFLRTINTNSHNIFIIDFDSGIVSARPKTNPHVSPSHGSLEDIRLNLYLAFIIEVSNRFNIKDKFSIALCVGDMVEEIFEYPVFGFQKKLGSKTILLPDPDFMQFDFYRAEFVEASHNEKSRKIIFCGSSTGKLLTFDDVNNDLSERLSYAAHFSGRDDVIVKIGAVVQCLSEEANIRLQQKHYIQSISWNDQLRCRYILSMDGNGATCSRVVLTLKSQSVLLKTVSPHKLYYFDGLRPFEHYIPVESIDNLEEVAKSLQDGTLDCAGIVYNANRFYEKYLTKESVEEYQYLLLRSFCDCINKY